LVDNAAINFCNQLDNGVPILPYEGPPNKNDKELKYLLSYLLSIRDHQDLRRINSRYFWLWKIQNAKTEDEALKYIVRRK